MVAGMKTTKIDAFGFGWGKSVTITNGSVMQLHKCVLQNNFAYFRRTAE